MGILFAVPVIAVLQGVAVVDSYVEELGSDCLLFITCNPIGARYKFKSLLNLGHYEWEVPITDPILLLATEQKRVQLLPMAVEIQ